MASCQHRACCLPGEDSVSALDARTGARRERAAMCRAMQQVSERARASIGLRPFVHSRRACGLGVGSVAVRPSSPGLAWCCSRRGPRNAGRLLSGGSQGLNSMGARSAGVQAGSALVRNAALGAKRRRKPDDKRAGGPPPTPAGMRRRQRAAVAGRRGQWRAKSA